MRGRVRLNEKRSGLFCQRGLQINRRPVERPDQTQSHHVLPDARGIGVDEGEARLFVQNHVAQSQITIVVTCCPRHTRPRFTRR